MGSGLRTGGPHFLFDEISTEFLSEQNLNHICGMRDRCILLEIIFFIILGSQMSRLKPVFKHIQVIGAINLFIKVVWSINFFSGNRTKN
jgi:hypothetical protein